MSGLRLELDSAGMTYQTGTHLESRALDAVSLTVEPGERLALAGPVGSGKSTLLGILAGVEPPTSGRVLHGVRGLSKRSQPEPGSIGLAFQTPENCLFEKTVFDEVAFAPKHRGLDGAGLRERVDEALDIVGLDPAAFGSRNPFTLSSGEQRRVALAAVLALEPRALLLDEPTAHLDPATRRDLVDRLVRLNEETGVTLVVVGHDMDELARLATRVVLIESGRVAADGSANEILTDAVLLRQHSLEPPGTVELCELLAEAIGAAIAPVLDEEAAVGILADIMDEK